MPPVDMQMGPLAAGDQFLKYEIRGLLGRGGHAFVYEGYDPFLDRHVAIKIIVNPADPGRDLRRRAQLEARVLVRLNHPNVVSVFDAGVTESGHVYIIMELLEGRTLRDALLDLRQLTVSEALHVGATVADGVQAAHREHTIHRDLKPENVFILPGNGAKVLDFGIAKFLGYGALTTQKDLLHGTMLYMSPEHLQGTGATLRSDVFALGAILYEVLSGVPPCLIGVQEPTMNALAWAQINRMPPPLDELTKTVPRHVARVVQRMLAKDPADRFATMQEVADVLRSAAARAATEGAGDVAPPRELWKKSAPLGPVTLEPRSPHTSTTRFGVPLQFDSTGLVPTPGAASSAAAAPSPVPAAHGSATDRSSAVGADSPATDRSSPVPAAVGAESPGTDRSSPVPAAVAASPAPGAPRTDEGSPSVSPNTAPGVTSGIRAAGAPDTEGRPPGRPRIGKVVAAAALLGTVAGIAVGFLRVSPRGAPPERSAPVAAVAAPELPPVAPVPAAPPSERAIAPAGDPAPAAPSIASEQATAPSVDPAPAAPSIARGRATAPSVNPALPVPASAAPAPASSVPAPPAVPSAERSARPTTPLVATPAARVTRSQGAHEGAPSSRVARHAAAPPKPLYGAEEIQ